MAAPSDSGWRARLTGYRSKWDKWAFGFLRFYGPAIWARDPSMKTQFESVAPATDLERSPLATTTQHPDQSQRLFQAVHRHGMITATTTHSLHKRSYFHPIQPASKARPRARTHGL